MPQKDMAQNVICVDRGFEADLFKAADKQRGNMEPSDHKRISLGMNFLKHFSDDFEAKRAVQMTVVQVAKREAEYRSDDLFWVPKKALCSQRQTNAKLPSIDSLVDVGKRTVGKDNEPLKRVLPMRNTGELRVPDVELIAGGLP